jgi:hypothetical protein
MRSNPSQRTAATGGRQIPSWLALAGLAVGMPLAYYSWAHIEEWPRRGPGGGEGANHLRNGTQKVAQRLALRPSKSFRLVLCCLLPPAVLGQAYLVHEWIRGSPLIKNDSPLAFLVLFITFLALAWYVGVPWQARRIFKQQKTLHVRIVFHFDTEGVRAESPHGASNIPWSHFRKWKANGRVLVLFQSDVLMTLVPLRALPDAASRDALLALVENGVGPKA